MHDHEKKVNMTVRYTKTGIFLRIGEETGHKGRADFELGQKDEFGLEEWTTQLVGANIRN